MGVVASLTHNTALSYDKKGHDKRSAKKASEFLTRLGLGFKDIRSVVHAIENHSNGEDIASDLDVALWVADKLDVTRDRLAVTGGGFLSRELNKVSDASVEISSQNFVLKYKADPDFDKLAIREWNKMVLVPQNAAEYLGRSFRFLINDEEVDLEFLR